MSKEYWAILKTIMKTKRKATIAISFKEDGIHSTDFTDYIGELFKKTERCEEIRKYRTRGKLKISDKEMQSAF